jgi:hypothetical protein
MLHQEHTRTAGILGMFGAVIFFLALLVEYRYGLFTPGSGPLYVLNELLFMVALAGMLVMLLGLRAARAGGDGRFARITLTLFPIALATIILATLISITTGNADNILFPLGGLSSMLFGLLAGIAVAVAGKWRGWTRYAPLLQGVYSLLQLVVMTLINGSPDPNLLTESLWMVTWFLMGLALYVNGKTAVAARPVG